MNSFIYLFNWSFIVFFFLLQKGYRSLHTAARKDFAKAAKLLLQKDHKPDVEAPVSWLLFALVIHDFKINMLSD